MDCSEKPIALEEGWASFFSAWVDQGLDSPDPIQDWNEESLAQQRLSIKSVPESFQYRYGQTYQSVSVCEGPGNEMRVLSFLWNVVAPDGLGVPFATLWNALAGQHLTSVEQLPHNLEGLGVDSKKLEPVWVKAFNTPYPR